MTNSLGVIDSNFPVPGHSPLQPINQFEFRHLQRPGLINLNNTCCHLSLILCFHRMGLIQAFEGDLVVAAGGYVLDWPALVLATILRALPSLQAFHIQSFLDHWNDEGRAPRLRSNDDLTIVDGILRQLPLSGHDNVPALTQYLASFECFHCGHVDEDCLQWDEKPFSVVPTINVPHSRDPVPIEILIRGLLDQRMRITCTQCRQQVSATWKVVKGAYTVLFFNRGGDGRGTVRTRLQLRDQTRTPPPPLDFLGELVSVVSRCADDEIGAAGGHFVSYHHVDGSWVKNDDNRVLKMCTYHPFNQTLGYETVDLLCYKN